MSGFLKTVVLSLLFLSILGGVLCAESSPAGDTITKKERDIILLMCATENPNYDIALAIDVSNSMDSVLPEWKRMAEKTIDLAQLGDTLVLIRFDEGIKPPVIQQLDKERDKELFKGVVRRIGVTHGWGTDIRRAYWLTLKTLREFNEGRKKKGEPVRLQQVVFISDGDDLPPHDSPFRNPGSPESMELTDLISDAQRSLRINIIPIGMRFDNYVPRIRTIKQEGSTAGNEKISKELKDFMDKLQDVLSRQYGQEIKDDNEKVPRSPYEFYITWLSNRLELTPDGDISTKRAFHVQVPCEVRSKFVKVRVEDMALDVVYNGNGGGVVKKGTQPFVSSLAPGASSKFTPVVEFPRNWSFSTKEYQGKLDVTVRGRMGIDIEVPASTPPNSKKKLVYTYPILEKKLAIPFSGKLPPALEFYFLVFGGGFAILAFLGLYCYKNALPIGITLKTESKARAYQVRNGQSVTIGGNADFELDNIQEVVASITRKARQFFLIPRREGILEGAQAGQGGLTPMPLKFGQSFTMNIDGTYFAVQLLEGDQEAAFSVEENISPEVTAGGDDAGQFNF